MKKFLFLVCLIALIWRSAEAQQTDTTKNQLAELSIEDLMKVEITSVSKKPEIVINAPQTVIVITEEDIIKRGYIDLEQIFHDLPGFDISRGNGTHYSNFYQRGYRSNNPDRTTLLIDGVEENDLWSGNIWLDRQYALSNIKRVEFIYGPSSTIYGANAFLGVVNIVTKDASEVLNGKKFGVNAQLNYGTWNTRYADVTTASHFKSVQWTMTARYFSSDEMDLSKYADWDYSLDKYDLGFYLQKLNISDSALAGKAMQLDKDAYYNDTKLNGIKPHYSNNTEDWSLHTKIKIGDFTLGAQTWRRDHGYGAWYRDDYELGPVFGAKWVANNTFIYANFEKKLSEKFSISSLTRGKIHRLDDDCKEYYYTGYLNGGLTLDYLMEENDTTITYNKITHKIDTLITSKNPKPYWWVGYFSTYSQQTSTELRTNYTFNRKFDVLTGVEVRFSHVQGQYITSTEKYPSETGSFPNIPGGNHFWSRDMGIFTQASYRPINAINVVLGGRLDNNKIRENAGYGWVFNPKLGIIYSPNDWVFKLLYSEAYKDAGNWTKYGTTPARRLTNPTLSPEKVKNTEFSMGYRITNNAMLDFSAFHAQYSGIVGTVIVPYIDEFGNHTTTQQHQPIGSLLIQGIQANFNYKWKNYSFYSNYTFTKPYNTAGEKKVRIGDIATHKANAGVQAMYFKKLNVHFRMNWVGDKPTGKNTTISTNPLNQIDGYTVFYGTLTYQVNDFISLQLSVNNIFDATYFHPGVRSAEGDYYASLLPQNARNFMGKILFKW